MSSFPRRMQLMIEREKKGHNNPMKLGSRLGVHNEQAADLLARVKREEKKHV